ncbi:MAG: hypothetical protein HQ463_02460 [Bacteroidetes bacterium]|nr:hypothetical protein [Bacteroidota bacterium]
MKKYILIANKILAILLFMLIAKSSNACSYKAKPKIKLDTAIFTATAMGCTTDSKMVETALYRKGGVKNVKIKDDSIKIVFNSSKISKDELIKVIENTGTCEDPNAKVHKVKVKIF